MASIQSIAKAKAAVLLLKQLTGIEPSLEYLDNYTLVYYQPDRLLQMQKQVEKMASAAPGDVRFDWLPIVRPMVLKKAAPYVLGILAFGYLLGKIR